MMIINLFFSEYEQRTWCISASPYTLQVATGSCDGVGCLWFLNYKSPLRFFAGHLDDILVKLLNMVLWLSY